MSETNDWRLHFRVDENGKKQLAVPHVWRDAGKKLHIVIDRNNFNHRHIGFTWKAMQGNEVVAQGVGASGELALAAARAVAEYIERCIERQEEFESTRTPLEQVSA